VKHTSSDYEARSLSLSWSAYRVSPDTKQTMRNLSDLTTFYECSE